ncbi:ATP-binding domain-containing protein [Streptomyces sp.]|uniref:ATP-binding domain-containing protein n=1 Tax=Streptomyces sp. TaxID=1931 RepID=UPI0039C969B3
MAAEAATPQATEAGEAEAATPQAAESGAGESAEGGAPHAAGAASCPRTDAGAPAPRARSTGGPDGGEPGNAGDTAPGDTQPRPVRTEAAATGGPGGTPGGQRPDEPAQPPGSHRPDEPAQPPGGEPRHGRTGPTATGRPEARSGDRPSGGPAGPRRAARRAPLDPAAVDAARGVLVGGGAPGALAEAAVRLLGEGAGEALRGDPWLVLQVPGVRVEQADGFARAVLGAECGPGDERRGRALVGFVLEKAAESGHTALAADAVRAALTRHAVPDPGAVVAAAVEEGLVLVFRDASAEPPAGPGQDDDEAGPVPLLLGLDRYALAEESLADGCVRLLRSFEGAADEEDDDAGWEKAAAGAPSPSAAELIRAAARSGLVLHTGGEAARAEPAALVGAARAAGLRAYAAAYTENGRRRLARAVGDEAALTVEGLLGRDLGPGRAEDGSLALDLLAVLDAPQLSAEEATTLVEAVPDGARLVLSGDPNTLWSAGPGRVFADLLASRACPRVISRTPDPGPIGELASCVSVGELAAVEAPEKEVVVVPVRDPGEAVLRTVQLVADSVPRAIGVPAAHTQVITLAHSGPVGTRALNAALKERLNPGPGRFAGFDPGDRVVHVPAPGHTLPGTVAGAEPDGLRLTGEWGTVVVPREDVAATVRHGWAVTGHQAAGLCWPAVVVVVPGDAGPLLTRSWVYTAFTRGERHLSVVRGADRSLAQAVAEPAAKERTTRLTSVLRELAEEG